MEVVWFVDGIKLFKFSKSLLEIISLLLKTFIKLKIKLNVKIYASSEYHQKVKVKKIFDFLVNIPNRYFMIFLRFLLKLFYFNNNPLESKIYYLQFVLH